MHAFRRSCARAIAGICRICAGRPATRHEITPLAFRDLAAELTPDGPRFHGRRPRSEHCRRACWCARCRRHRSNRSCCGWTCWPGSRRPAKPVVNPARAIEAAVDKYLASAKLAGCRADDAPHDRLPDGRRGTGGIRAAGGRRGRQTAVRWPKVAASPGCTTRRSPSGRSACSPAWGRCFTCSSSFPMMDTTCACSWSASGCGPCGAATRSIGGPTSAAAPSPSRSNCSPNGRTWPAAAAAAIGAHGGRRRSAAGPRRTDVCDRSQRRAGLAGPVARRSRSTSPGSVLELAAESQVLAARTTASPEDEPSDDQSSIATPKSVSGGRHRRQRRPASDGHGRRRCPMPWPWSCPAVATSPASGSTRRVRSPSWKTRATGSPAAGERWASSRQRGIALLVRPGREFIALVFALFKAGAVDRADRPGHGAAKSHRLLARRRAGRLRGDSRRAGRAHGCCGGSFRTARYNVTVGHDWFSGGVTLDELRRLGFARADLCTTRGADDPAAIIFTTGSTGPPKGVLYAHGNFDRQVTELREFYGIEPGEVDLPGFPLFGLFNCAMGVTTVIPDMERRARPGSTRERSSRPSATGASRSRSARRRSGTGWAVLPAAQRRAAHAAPRAFRPAPGAAARAGAHERLHRPRRRRAHALRRDRGLAGGLDRGQRGPRRNATPLGPRRRHVRRPPLPGHRVEGHRDPRRTDRRIDDVVELPAGEIGEMIVSGPVVTRQYVTRPRVERAGEDRRRRRASGTAWATSAISTSRAVLVLRPQGAPRANRGGHDVHDSLRGDLQPASGRVSLGTGRHRDCTGQQRPVDRRRTVAREASPSGAPGATGLARRIVATWAGPTR